MLKLLPTVVDGPFRSILRDLGSTLATLQPAVSNGGQTLLKGLA